ncbi:MAG: Lrp/AsnC ligand binding domain-containing protein [Candidatus Hydrothermarchaeota archaeon]
MVVAVCFINAALGKEVKARKKLGSVRGARRMIELFGEYDFLLILEGESLEEINSIVDDLRELKEVRSTKTIIGADT